MAIKFNDWVPTLPDHATPASGDLFVIINTLTNATEKLSYSTLADLLPIFGPNVLTVQGYAGGPGQYATLQDACDAAGDRTTVRFSGTNTVTLTNGSAVVTGSGTTWKTLQGANKTSYIRAGDLVQFAPDTDWYKVKTLDSDTQITLYESYQGTTRSTSLLWKSAYLDWREILLMPGEYLVGGVNVYPGIAIRGFSRDLVRMSEIQSSPGYLFDDWGENRLTDITCAPTTFFGAMDSFMQSSWPNLWHGAQSVIEGCVFEFGNPGNAHAGGTGKLPLLQGGISIIQNCRFRGDHAIDFFPTVSRQTVTSSDSQVYLQNNHHLYQPGADVSGILLQSALYVDGGEFFIDGVTINFVDDFGISPVLFKPAGITLSDDGIIHLSNSRIHVANSPDADGIHVESFIGTSLQFDITGCDIEVLGGTTGYGIHCNKAGAVVNVRMSRVKGNSSAVHCAAGTVNIDTPSTSGLIGGTSGAGTINTNTPT